MDTYDQHQEIFSSDFYDELADYISNIAETPESITEDMVLSELSHVVKQVVLKAKIALIRKQNVMPKGFIEDE